MKQSKPLAWSIFGVGASLIGIGSGLLTLAPDRSPIFLIPLINFLGSYVNYFGTACLIIGLSSLIIGFLLWPAEKLTDVIISKIMRRTHIYTAIVAGKPDLEELYAHYESLFGTDIVPIDQMSSWLDKNGQIVTKIMKKMNSNPEEPFELVGFFDIEALTKYGEDKIRQANRRIGSITKSDIHSEKLGNPKAFYIGCVGCPTGSTIWLKGITMVFLIQKLKIISSGRTITVYARPVTDDGVYLVKDLFQMTKRHAGADKEVIWSKDINSNNFAPPAAYMKIAKRAGIEL